MVKRFITSLFLVFLFSFFLVTPSKAEPINLQDPDIKNCFDQAIRVEWADAIKYNNLLRECLGEINNDQLWSCNITQNNTSEPNITACAGEFSASVCRGVNDSVSGWGRQGRYVDRCNEARDQYNEMFIGNATAQLVCPVAFQSEIDSMSIGAYDTAIELCNPIDKGGCLNSLRLAVINRINKAQNDACTNYSPSSELNESLSSVFSDRFDIVNPPPSEEVQAARNTFIDTIDSCKSDNGAIRCLEFVDCVGNAFDVIPADNAIWTCPTRNLGNCRDQFIRFITQNYSIWLRDLDAQYKNDDLNCSQPLYTEATVIEHLDERLRRDQSNNQDIYTRKQFARDQAEGEGEEIDEVDGIYPEDFGNQSLIDTVEELNCGFAGIKGKNACCTNTLKDSIDLNSLSQAGDAVSGCIIDNPFDSGDACWISKEVAFKPILDFVMGDLESTTIGLEAFLDESGNIPKCFVGTDTEDDPCTCEIENGAQLCKRYIARNDKAAIDGIWKQYKPFADCVTCMQDNNKDGYPIKFYTALGCIDTSTSGISEFIFTVGIGIGGLIALFCIIFSAIQMQISQGNPEQVQKSQQNITSCITGLILIIFSIFILRVIGVDILRIPGFSSSGGAQNEETEIPESAEQTPIPTTIALGQGSNVTPTSVPLPTATSVPSPIQTITNAPQALPSPSGSVSGDIRIGSAVYFENNTVNPSLDVAVIGARFIYQTNDNAYYYSDTINGWVASANIDNLTGATFQVVEVEYPEYLLNNLQ